MSGVLRTMLFRGTRRIRLIFSAPLLSPDAFFWPPPPSSSPYFATESQFTVTDGAGNVLFDATQANIGSIVATCAILSDASAIELVLSEDLQPGTVYGVNYRVNFAAGGGRASGTQYGTTNAVDNAPATNVEPTASDLELLLFGRDLSHDGNDFVLAPDEDLDTIGGRPNYKGALLRRMLSTGLPWDPSYSPQAAQFVNAPDAFRLPLAGSLVAQARLDDRTLQASVTVTADPEDPDAWLFQLAAQPKDNLDPVVVFVPPGGPLPGPNTPVVSPGGD